MKHKPSRFLCNVKGAGKLTRRDPVPVGGDEPNRWQPFVEADRGILKDRADLRRKLPLANTAVPPAILRQVLDVNGAAIAGASDAVRPAHLGEVIVRYLRVGEPRHRFERGVRKRRRP